MYIMLCTKIQIANSQSIVSKHFSLNLKSILVLIFIGNVIKLPSLISYYELVKISMMAVSLINLYYVSIVTYNRY